MKGNFKVDETDKRILGALRENCRRSARELALEIKISPSALIERIKRLEKSGIIRGYSADLDYSLLGHEFQGIVQINISQGKILEVQDNISKLPGVVAVYDITGNYDSIAMVMCKTRAEFSTLLKKILSIPHVEKTNTIMVLNVVKHMHEFDGL
ncbi:Lrp/AsnC family transcriptional regulator [Candidatus Micrarchaeota archaeon]|nr:Lrp/AsnC family transcriptional regulator [Candidatus Micrarchaeota archaeon]